MRTAWRGLPQGGVLSSILYIFYVARIYVDIPKTVKISQFADDIVLCCSCSSITERKNLLGNATITVKNNLRCIGLDLSPQKTVSIHFNNRRMSPGEMEINIEINSIKFLGI